MRPFSTLGVKPFLFLSESSTQILHQIFLEKNLELHPDRLPAAARKPDSPEAQAAEEKAAVLNADYADIKSPERLIKRVLMDNLGPPTVKSSLPPAFAMEYFDFQEKVESLNLCLGHSLPDDLQKELVQFKNRIEKECEKKTQERTGQAMQFPFLGKAESANDSLVPWKAEDLIKLQSIDFEIRFFNQFLNDLKRRFG